ncbi:MAG TPA: O-antigen ligase family protein [Bacteroidia bacterium]|jgi:O-antigen ligase/lipoprotein NlpI
MKSTLLNRLLVIIPVVLIPLIISGKTIDPALLPKFMAFSIYLLFFGALILYRCFFSPSTPKVNILQNFLFLVFTGFIISAALSLLQSRNPADGIFELLKHSSFLIFLMFTVIYFQDDDKLINTTCKATAVLSAAITVIGLCQFAKLVSSGVSHNATYQVDATFANRNLFAEVLLMSLPFILYGSIKFRGGWRYICHAVAAGSLFLITVTLSRAVWLGFTVAAVATLAAWLLFSYKKKDPGVHYSFKNLLLPLLILSVSVLSAVFFYSRADSGETFSKQISSISNLKFGGANERLELWRKSISLFREQPLTGIGLASWKIDVLRYNVSGTKQEDAETFYQYPHNDFIMTAAETGVFGFMLYTLLFITILYYITVILKRTGREEHTFYLLSFFGVIAYGVISLFSFPKERIEQNILLMLLFCIIILRYNKLRKEGSDVSQGNKPMAVILITVCLVLISASVFITKERIRSDLHTLKALDAKKRKNWEKVISEIDLALSPYYQLDPMSTPLLWYRGTANFNLNRNEKALEDFENAGKLNPYHIHILNNAGTCYELKGDHLKAIECYNKAIALNPAMEEAILNLAASYYNAGMKEEAYDALRKCEAGISGERYTTSLRFILKDKFGVISTSVHSGKLPARLKQDQATWKSRKLKFSKLNTDEFENLYKSTVLSRINHIASDNSWLHRLHEKSIQNRISLEEQIFIDAYFLEHKIKL